MVRRIVALLRATNPDLALFMKFASRLPFKYQENILSVLPPDEREAVRRAYEEVGRGGAT